MKHTLKFRTANLYTKDSDFLFNAIITLLYVIPIVLILWNMWIASYNKELSTQLNDAETTLQDKVRKYKNSIAKLKPNIEDETVLQKKYNDYSVILSACNTSWATIIENLETITPSTIRFQRIAIRPEKTLKIKLEGRAKNLNDLTEYLRKIYSSEVFANPILKNHRKVNQKNKLGTEISFSLELTYIAVANEEGEKE